MSDHIIRRQPLAEYGVKRYDIERDDELRDIICRALLAFPEMKDKSFLEKAWKTWVDDSLLTFDKEGKRIKRTMQRSDTDFLGYQLLMPLMKKYGCKELDEIPAKVKEFELLLLT